MGLPESGKTMIRSLVLLLIPCVSLATTLEEELIAVHEEQMTEYMLHHNVEPLAGLSEESYFFIAGIGLLESRDQVLKTAMNLAVKQVSFSNDKVVINNGTAILSGIIDIEGTVMGHPLPKQLRYLSVFVETVQGWKLQARSVTPVRLPPGVVPSK